MSIHHDYRMSWSTVLENRVTVTEESSWPLWNLIIHCHLHKNLLFVCILDTVFLVPPDFHSYYMLYVVGISMSLKQLTSFHIAGLWYDRSMILFCYLKTCRVVIRYVLICFLFITDTAWWSIEWTGSKWFWWYGKEMCVSFGDMVRKCVYNLVIW
jgi:hypothetical protein